MAGSKSQLDLAWTLLGQNRPVEALRIARSELARQPRNVSALVCVAMANWRIGGDIETSLAQLRRAVEAAPNEASIRHNYATLLASNGDIDEAAVQFRHALRIKPDDTLAFYGLAQNHKFREYSELVAQMEALHKSLALDANRREFLCFGLTKVFDDLDEPERAMAYACEGNDLVRRPYDVRQAMAELVGLKELAKRDAFRQARGSGHPSRAPVFIVGMNRSGTTLIESILSRHPDVLALGESLQLPRVEAQGGERLAGDGRRRGRYAATLELDRDWLSAQAEAILKAASARAGKPFKTITDKLPDNALRLGLIAQLFPKARVIYVRRHPLDVGVSNYLQHFSAGQAFSFRLDWIGVRTRQIAETMEIWRRVLDLRILDVSYEKLVRDPEQQIRRIVAFLGLDWTDACLQPERTPRAVLTASQWQIRQPINTASVARWVRYEPWLGPMIETMGGMDWVEREVAEIAKAA